MNQPHRNYPHLVVLKPRPNVSRTRKPSPVVFTGFMYAVLFEAIAVAAIYFGHMIWRLI